MRATAIAVTVALLGLIALVVALMWLDARSNRK